MSSIILKAHFDGTHIQLDEPYQLPRDAKLLVAVVSPSRTEEECFLLELSQRSLEHAYGNHEPDYGDADLLP